MASAEPRLPVEELRRAALAYRKATSIRKAAAAVGLSPTGLRAFLAGTDPHPSTLERLTAWYVRTARERGEGVTPEVAGAALALLTEHLPDERREEAEREVRAVIQKATEADRGKTPEWLRE